MCSIWLYLWLLCQWWLFLLTTCADEEVEIFLITWNNIFNPVFYFSLVWPANYSIFILFPLLVPFTLFWWFSSKLPQFFKNNRLNMINLHQYITKLFLFNWSFISSLFFPQIFINLFHRFIITIKSADWEINF